MSAPVKKVKAGHYVHKATGIHIVATGDQYPDGPRGGLIRGWEFATLRPDGELIIEEWAASTLRGAVAVLRSWGHDS